MQGSMDVSSGEQTPLGAFLNRIMQRSVLTADEQQAILDLPTQTVHLRGKQDFVHINEQVAYSCLVVSGVIARVGQTAKGARQITSVHLPGEMADLHSAVRPIGLGGMTALCPSTILRISHGAIRQVAARFPAIAEAFWRDCMLESAILLQWLLNVGRRDAQTRLAHIFCEVAVRLGRNRTAACQYDFPVTQEQLGDAAAMTSVHVNRSLRALHARGLLTVTRGRVTIHQWEALARAGEFDPTYLLADMEPHRQERLRISV
ncbi:cAMP-binding domain of CRP or a regulatory subunit of cAMP-dependent protein kinases [Sphingomonas guangdongensis]|uniref:cAMP-binding domain of CRP or a regulatory subunit of cAMP-dependent protein kinases n=2 Tax=Sphingomonas guangdongensis TaxID=1141890 RepID=A0A285QXP2_9SPHN|nr:cAMP-binding domain of CRP or a regulatory subunit of cAMP-dependent protein kinases [Sphingomonas guangdongensis]